MLQFRCLQRRGFLRGLPLAAIALLAPPPALQAESPPRPDAHPELVRLSKTDDIWVDRDARQVVVGGVIALDKGVIEVFACQEHSKEHEAIVATRAPARLVHAGLLAIGLEPGKPVSFDPEYVPASGPVVAVRMRWKDADGTRHERPAQELIRTVKTGGPLDAQWVFAGSVFWKDPLDGTEYYQADGGDMICVSNFTTAMLDLPIESSQGNESLLFEVFEGRVPPRGTEVELVLAPGG